MRKYRLVAPTSTCALLLLLATAGAAWANDPWFVNKSAFNDIGRVLVRGLVLLATLEVSVCVGEALAYWGMAGLRWRQALRTATVANVASIVLGLPLSAVLMRLVSPGSSGGALLVGLIVTEVVEVPLVMVMNGPQTRPAAGPSHIIRGGTRPAQTAHERLLATAVGANLVSYVLFWTVLILVGEARMS